MHTSMHAWLHNMHGMYALHVLHPTHAMHVVHVMHQVVDGLACSFLNLVCCLVHFCWPLQLTGFTNLLSRQILLPLVVGWYRSPGLVCPLVMSALSQTPPKRKQVNKYMDYLVDEGHFNHVQTLVGPPATLKSPPVSKSKTQVTLKVWPSSRNVPLFTMSLT